MNAASPPTRLLSRVLTLFLRVLRHVRLLGTVDFGQILTNHTEAVLNLPGKLRFFPTNIIDFSMVEALLGKLHPVASGKELIRLGPRGDGGYLIPDDLEGIKACFSPGVSNIAGFEIDCADRGMEVFMADGSVEMPPAFHPRFTFTQQFIGPTTRANFISLQDWVDKSLPDFGADLLLQMDIEGSEYAVLLSVPERLLRRFRIIVIEFHYLDYLFSQPIFAFYFHVFQKLLRHHTCVHIHPNNTCPPLKIGDLEIPQMAEFTFLRSDRILQHTFARNFPHPLDCDNTARASLALPRSLFRAT